MSEHKEPIAGRLQDYIDLLKRHNGRPAELHRTERRNGHAELADLELLAESLLPVVRPGEPEGYFAAHASLEAEIRSGSQPLPSVTGHSRKPPGLSRWRIAAMLVLCLLACAASAYSYIRYLAAHDSCPPTDGTTAGSSLTLPYLPARAPDPTDGCELPVNPKAIKEKR